MDYRILLKGRDCQNGQNKNLPQIYASYKIYTLKIFFNLNFYFFQDINL